MRLLPLTNGSQTIVDDNVYQWARQWSWHLGGSGYAYRYNQQQTNEGTKRVQETLHRLVIGAPRGTITDHLNGNKQDNRRANLRLCTTLENAWNRAPQKSSKTGFRGVSWNCIAKKWVARIAHRGKREFIGNFDSPIDAAKAWNEAAKKYHGKFARLNKISQND